MKVEPTEVGFAFHGFFDVLKEIIKEGETV